MMFGTTRLVPHITNVRRFDLVPHKDVLVETCQSVSKSECEKVAKKRNVRYRELNVNLFPPGCYHNKRIKAVYYNNALSKASCSIVRTCVCEDARGKLYL